MTFVNGGSVEADIAGGFAGDFQGGKVNIYTDDDLKDATGAYARAKTAAEQSPWGVINIDHVTGGAYAGGWGGRVTSGALASAGKGGISLLGKLGTVDIAQLLDVSRGTCPHQPLRRAVERGHGGRGCLGRQAERLPPTLASSSLPRAR